MKSMSSTLKIRGRMAGLAAAVALVGTVGLAAPASAASSGTKGCGTNYGWLTASVPEFSQYKAPGSQVIRTKSLPGTYTEVAIYSNGAPKTGGGAWFTSPSQYSSGVAFCRSWA